MGTCRPLELPVLTDAEADEIEQGIEPDAVVSAEWKAPAVPADEREITASFKDIAAGTSAFAFRDSAQEFQQGQTIALFEEVLEEIAFTLHHFVSPRVVAGLRPS